LAFSEKAFAKLSKDDSALVTKILTETISAIDKNSRTDNLKAFSALKTQGLSIIKPDNDEKISLKSKADLATERLVAQGEFSQQILDEVNKLLTEFRAD